MREWSTKILRHCLWVLYTSICRFLCYTVFSSIKSVLFLKKVNQFFPIFSGVWTQMWAVCVYVCACLYVCPLPWQSCHLAHWQFHGWGGGGRGGGRPPYPHLGINTIMWATLRCPCMVAPKKVGYNHVYREAHSAVTDYLLKLYQRNVENFLHWLQTTSVWEELNQTTSR